MGIALTALCHKRRTWRASNSTPSAFAAERRRKPADTPGTMSRFGRLSLGLLQNVWTDRLMPVHFLACQRVDLVRRARQRSRSKTSANIPHSSVLLPRHWHQSPASPFVPCDAGRDRTALCLAKSHAAAAHAEHLRVLGSPTRIQRPVSPGQPLSGTCAVVCSEGPRCILTASRVPTRWKEHAAS